MNNFILYSVGTGIIVLSVTACGVSSQVKYTSNTTSVIAHGTTMNFPKANKIISTRITGSEPASIWYVPKNNQDQSRVISDVLKWLKASKQTQVKKPKNLFHGTINAYVGPAVLHIKIKDKKKPVIVRPAYFIVSKHKDHFSTQYVTGVIAYGNQKHLTYLKSKKLYQWLKQNQWKKDFKQLH